MAILHGQLSTGWVRQPDSTASCGRMGDVGACGTYFPVTDHIGKVVVMVDSQARIVGTGEYDPFGQVNRVTTDKETTHNYCCGTSCPSTATTAEKNCNPSSPGGTRVDFATLNAGSVTGMTTDYRAKLQMIDLRSGYNCLCSLPGKGISDSVGLAESNNDSAVITQSILGAHAGTNWTTWATPASGAAVAQLYYGYYTSTGQLSCFGTCVATAGPAFNRTGAVMEGWEYRRYTTGATPFWTPLRFPGQYHDEETDLNQNWNRFYEPMTGRYLEAEPMFVRHPMVVQATALSGQQMPYFSYAGNNPVYGADFNGMVWFGDPACVDASSLGDCIKQAERIKDAGVQSCVIRQCADPRLYLSCDKRRPTCVEHNVGSAGVGNPRDPARDIDWCNEPLSDRCQSVALVHELAHTCGNVICDGTRPLSFDNEHFPLASEGNGYTGSDGVPRGVDIMQCRFDHPK